MRMVEIYVGPEKQQFHIHKDFIRRVPYFDKMFNGDVNEAQEQAADLPEDGPVIFSLFVELLYTSPIPSFSVTGVRVAI